MARYTDHPLSGLFTSFGEDANEVGHITSVFKRGDDDFMTILVGSKITVSDVDDSKYWDLYATAEDCRAAIDKEKADEAAAKLAEAA